MNKKNRNILLVSSEYPPGPGGIGNHAYSLTKALADRGYFVTVVTNADYANPIKVDEFDHKQKENISIKRIFNTGIKTYYNRIREVKRVISSNDVGTVLLSGKFSLWIGGVLKYLGYKFNSVAVLHGSEVKMSNILFKRFTDYCISKADYLVPVSAFTHSLLSDELQKKPFRIVENGIDIGEMNLLDEADTDKLKLPGNPALLTVGNVTPRKGQHRVIKALPEIIKKFPDVHYNIVGLPTYEKEFADLAQSLGVGRYVTFHGRLPERSDLATAYKKADCFIILSENQPDGDVEGFGIVILEANYFGLPAIGAKGCGIEDAIEDDYNGYLVDGDDSKEISDKLSLVLNSREKMSINSVEWANNHSWERIVERYVEVVQ